MQENIKILIVEDYFSDAALAEMELKKVLKSIDTMIVETEGDFLQALNDYKPDLIISDYSLPSFDGLRALKLTLEYSPVTPFIMLTGSINEETAVECMKAGATDYVIKEHIKRLGSAVLHALLQKDIVAEKMEAEKALRKSEKLNRSITETASDAIITLNSKGVILTWNKTAEKIFGYSSSEMLDKDFSVILSTKSLKKHELEFESLIESNKENLLGSTFEITALRRDRSEFPIELSLSSWESENQRYYTCIIRDITDRKKAEDEIRENNRKLNTLFNNLQGMAYRSKNVKEWTKEFVSNGCKELTGYNVDDLLFNKKISYSDIIYPDDKNRIWNEVQNAINNKKPFELSYRIITADNKIKWVNENGVAVFDEDSGEFLAIEGFVWDVTEKKKSQDKLKESEEKFRLLFEKSYEGIVKIDTNAKIVLVNPRLVEMTGYSQQELLQMYLIDLLPEDENENYIYRLENLKKNISENFESKLLRKDGTILWILVSASPLFNNEGDYIGGFGTFTDITGRKLAEEKSRGLNRIIEESLNEVYMFSVETLKFIRVNYGGRNNLGYTIEELEKLTPIDLKPEFNYDSFRALTNPLVKGEKKVLVYETVHLRKDGSLYPVEVHLQLHNYTGQQVFVAIINDITDRVKVEEERKLLSTAIEQSPAAVLITDPHGNIEFINPKFTQITGYSLEEVKGKNTNILSSGKQTKKYYEEMWNTILSGKNWEGEIINKKKNGELYWAKLSISPLVNNDGDISHFISVKEDITEKKKLIEELIKSKEKAEEMNRVKSYFFANMSHELRTPFIGIIGYAEILTESLENEEDREMAKAILDSSERMVGTLNKILNLTKIELDEIKLNYSDVDINNFINEFASKFIITSSKKNLSFNFSVNSKSTIISTDENILHEILNNLVENAIKYTEKGRVDVICDLVKRNNSDYIAIKVQDTGIGIPENLQKVIWDEFRQVSEGFSREFQGSGLGLAIVKKLTKLINAEITLSSKVGEGSLFTLYLPVNH